MAQELTELINAVPHLPEGLKKLVVELPVVNGEAQQKIPSLAFIEQLELLKKLGVHHIGYYPDDVYLYQRRLANFTKTFFATYAALLPNQTYKLSTRKS